ncbi:hypothetical protein RIF29_20103 [Crotalaria pallida]|uniref:26S proteasome complex subunit SEM1 n=1 Tax=Crotalaria pallida TaxID=3830 RepID=A0AAN9I755_CROPI
MSSLFSLKALFLAELVVHSLWFAHSRRRSPLLVHSLRRLTSPFGSAPSAGASCGLLMATETKAAAEDVKIDLFEDDDEFEEFEINEEWDDKEGGKEVTQQWEDDWDDDDVSDDFSLQLKRELENNTEKN